MHDIYRHYFLSTKMQYIAGIGAEAIFHSARLSAPGAEKSRQMSALGSAPLEILKMPKYIVLNFEKNIAQWWLKFF